MFKRFLSILLIKTLLCFALTAQTKSNKDGTQQLTGPDARQYICYRAANPPVIDGVFSEEEWTKAEWSNSFIDITGDLGKKPRFNTRVKMLWDNDYLYIAAELEEPHVSGRLTQRDAVIFNDNDFEIFIDPDGDTHNYYEIELNALNTVWDLSLSKPYRDGAQINNGFNIESMKSAVAISGTLNNPVDKDEKWSIEIALPFKSFTEPGYRIGSGDQWRINFSRVEWQYRIVENSYLKVKDPVTGKNLPEDNWVWSPQGEVNMHRPEMWGYLQFSDKTAGEGKDAFILNPDEKVKWSLRTLYYAQVKIRQETGNYSSDNEILIQAGYEPKDFLAKVEVAGNYYFAKAKSPFSGLIWEIDKTGLIRQRSD
jgi:hypothetical protein